MFDTRLKQNIAFSCYYTPLTIAEIARKLSVPSIYVDDEMKLLEEYGYIDRMGNGKNPKYRTNMYITDGRLFQNDIENAMMKEAAARYCEEFYAKVFEDFDASSDNWGFSCDGDDKNFIKYTLVMMCVWITESYVTEGGYAGIEKYRVKRPDGGNFIAHADIRDPEKAFADNPYWNCGFMNRFVDHYESIQFDCRFSNRSKLTWRDNLDSDWDSLYQFIKSGCDKNALESENYKRLCDKGYIYQDRVQVVTAL